MAAGKDEWGKFETQKITLGKAYQSVLTAFIGLSEKREPVCSNFSASVAHGSLKANVFSTWQPASEWGDASTICRVRMLRASPRISCDLCR